MPFTPYNLWLKKGKLFGLYEKRLQENIQYTEGISGGEGMMKLSNMEKKKVALSK